MKYNLKIDENIYLITQKVNDNITVEVSKNIDFIFKIDVSGSMSYDLPLIRTQLKNKLPSLTKIGDRVTIIWFSGRDEAGILVECVEIKSLKTFDTLNNSIDKWLRPVGMTAFKKPYELMKDVIERIKKTNSNPVISSIFLSDGGNNSVPWSDVIQALKNVEADLASSLIVEYGYYADSQKLTEMSAILGAEKVSCSSFDDYDVVFEKKLTSSISGGKKSVVEISDKYLYDFAFSVNDGSVLLYNIIDGKILVGNDVKEVHFFSANEIGNENKQQDAALYAAIYLFSDMLKMEIAEKVFYALGDNYYYQMFANAFGKQKLYAFKTAIKDCIADATKRFIGGKGAIQKIDDNAYCFMNLIDDLTNMKDCLFYPNHPDFKYNRIGVKKIQKESVLSDDDKKKLFDAKTITDANNILNELKENNVSIKFIESEPNKGYLINDLVWNEERANLSVRICVNGKAILPTNKFNINEISTFKYKTLTLVKDGLINVDKLPVSFSTELVDLLVKNNVKFINTYDSNTDKAYVVIDLMSLPIINRSMVKSISANNLAKLEWELAKLQGSKKVYDYYKKLLYPKTSKSFIELLGEEAAAWLKEIGITDFNGFNPPMTSAESTDSYVSVILATKIKGLSSLPKVDDVIKKIKDNKSLNIADYVMADSIIKYSEQINSDIYKSLNEEQQKIILKTYLETKYNILNQQKKKIMQEISQIKFALILSKRWFIEFKSFDENKLTAKFDDKDLDFTFVLSEEEVKI